MYMRHTECTGDILSVQETYLMYRRHTECTGDILIVQETRQLKELGAVIQISTFLFYFTTA